MAQEAVAEVVPDAVIKTEEDNSPAAQGMDVETLTASADQTDGDATAAAGNGEEIRAKRKRDEEDEGDESKQPKVEKSVEEKRLEKSEAADGENGSGAVAGAGPVSVGPKTFGTAVEMFDYFFKFLHFWSPNLNVNEYEHMMLVDLIKKGHLEPEKKIGKGIKAFQVRYHPQWKSRCFFIVREDDTSDDFSFRKCVDHILPLPETMRIKADVNKALGGKGGGRGGGRGHWRGHGRGKGGRGRH